MKPIHHLVSLLFLLPPWSTIKNQAFCGSRLMRSLGPNKWWNRAQNRIFLRKWRKRWRKRLFSIFWSRFHLFLGHFPYFGPFSWSRAQNWSFSSKFLKWGSKTTFFWNKTTFSSFFFFYSGKWRFLHLFSSFGPLFVDDVGAQIRWKRKRGFHSFSWSTNGFSWKKRRSRNGKKKSCYASAIRLSIEINQRTSRGII